MDDEPRPLGTQEYIFPDGAMLLFDDNDRLLGYAAWDKSRVATQEIWEETAQ